MDIDRGYPCSAFHLEAAHSMMISHSFLVAFVFGRFLRVVSCEGR